MYLRLLAYFFSLYLSVTAFSYYAFGKQVIETQGYMDGTATLNKFDDFLILCLINCLFVIIIFGITYLLLKKISQYIAIKNLVLKPLHSLIIFTALWLVIATLTAGGCAENWGNTWTTFEIFNFFVLSKALIALPFLLTGLILTLIIKKYQ